MGFQIYFLLGLAELHLLHHVSLQGSLPNIGLKSSMIVANYF
jgi:hypothetical protein